MSDAAAVSNTGAPHGGGRVQVQERPAGAITGWFGVLALAICVGAAIALPHTSNPRWWLAVPVVVFALVLQSLVVAAPGQTRVVQFFGRYVGTVRRPGFWWVLPLTVRREVVSPGAELRDQSSQGQRRRRQPGRDRGHRGVAGHRHGESDLRGGQLPGFRHCAGRVRSAARRDHSPLRRF